MKKFYRNIGLAGFIFFSVIQVYPALGKSECESEKSVRLRLTPKEFASIGRKLIFGGWVKRTIGVMTGRGRCSLCHTFDKKGYLGRGPNLFRIEKLSHVRVKESKYKKHPIPVGSRDPFTDFVKGAKTGEDYIRESMKCPSCYIVEGYESEKNSLKSSCPAVQNPPYNISDLEIDAIIAYLQSHSIPGNYSKVTVEMPLRRELRGWKSYLNPCYSIQ